MQAQAQRALIPGIFLINRLISKRDLHYMSFELISHIHLF